MWCLSAILVIVAVLAVEPSDARSPLKPSRLYQTQIRPGRDVCPPPRIQVGSYQIDPQYFNQYLDHDVKNQTFLQRFWQNNQWYKSGGPQFLMLDGEAATASTWVERDDLEWTSIAKEVGARAFLLEHRFYGRSVPRYDPIHDTRQYLTSQQAAADVVHFISSINAELNITNPRWILFGGSYAGALSAWIREKYPDYVYAAVASSAPVQAVVDFKESFEVVYNALHTYDPKCAESVRKGFADFNKLLETPLGRGSLKSTFRLCNDIVNIDNNTRYYLYEALINNYKLVVQFSEINAGDYATHATISEVCTRQLGADSDLDGIAAVNNLALFEILQSCLEVDYNQYILDFKNSIPGYDEGDYSSWLWQQCNEFGFFRSTDSDLVSTKFTGMSIPIDYYIQQCELVFGLTNATVYSNIDKTNGYYYGQNGYNGTRVAFPSGTNDPYHVLSVLKPTNKEVYPNIIAGTGHCADMYPESPNDKPGLTAARKAIRSLVTDWSTDKD